MKKLILISTLILSNAFAVDTYNASNGQLTIPSVNVSGVIYNNVVVTVGNVLSVGTTSTPNQSAEGLWAGTLSNGYVMNSLVLENNEYWNVIGSITGGNFYVNAFDNGAYITNGNVGTTYYREYYPSGPALLGYGLGVVTSGVSIIETVAVGAYNPVKVTLTPIASSQYNYNQSANLSDVAGVWSGSFLTGFSGTINVSANGSFTGVASTCVFSGSFKPRASGKNVFDFITVNGNGCGATGLASTGVAITFITSTGKRQLLGGGVDTSKTLGDMFFAQR